MKSVVVILIFAVGVNAGWNPDEVGLSEHISDLEKRWLTSVGQRMGNRMGIGAVTTTTTPAPMPEPEAGGVNGTAGPPKPPPTAEELLKDPNVQAILKKIPEIVRSPKIQELIKQDPLKTLLLPENVKKAIMTGSLRRFATLEYVRKFEVSAAGKHLMEQYPKLKQAIEGPHIKDYLQRFKSLLPILLAVVVDEVHPDPPAGPPPPPQSPSQAPSQSPQQAPAQAPPPAGRK